MSSAHGSQMVRFPYLLSKRRAHYDWFRGRDWAFHSGLIHQVKSNSTPRCDQCLPDCSGLPNCQTYQVIRRLQSLRNAQLFLQDSGWRRSASDQTSRERMSGVGFGIWEEKVVNIWWSHEMIVLSDNDRSKPMLSNTDEDNSYYEAGHGMVKGAREK